MGSSSPACPGESLGIAILKSRVPIMNSHDETPTTKPRVVKGKFSAQKFNHYQCGMKKWTVVWCDEGSLSDEKQSMRDGFIDLAHKHGATFLCLKKSTQLRTVVCDDEQTVRSLHFLARSQALCCSHAWARLGRPAHFHNYFLC